MILLYNLAGAGSNSREPVIWCWLPRVKRAGHLFAEMESIFKLPIPYKAVFRSLTSDGNLSLL